MMWRQEPPLPCDGCRRLEEELHRQEPPRTTPREAVDALRNAVGWALDRLEAQERAQTSDILRAQTSEDIRRLEKTALYLEYVASDVDRYAGTIPVLLDFTST